MRPRLRSRGERGESWVARPGARRLQCGHDFEVVENERITLDVTAGPCFNAATTSKSWRTSLTEIDGNDEVALQCGHDFEVVENSPVTTEHGVTPCRGF